MDFLDTTVGLHVNGAARICSPAGAPISLTTDEYRDQSRVSLIERWVVIGIDEAYIHCSKHVPRLQMLEKMSAGVRTTRRPSPPASF